jgi:hypothetical protein
VNIQLPLPGIMRAITSVKGLIEGVFSHGFICGIMIGNKIWSGESIRCRNPTVRVEN